MYNLPGELINIICSQLPTKHHLKSTCRFLHRIIPPGEDVTWYYRLCNQYGLTLRLHGDIKRYNKIFGISYRTWKDIYDIYVNNYNRGLDVIDFHILGIYHRPSLITLNINDILCYDVHFIYHIGLLKLLPVIRELPHKIWNELSVDEIYDILDTNCIIINNNIVNIVTILKQYISRNNNVDRITGLDPFYITWAILTDEGLYYQLRKLISVILNPLDRRILYKFRSVLTTTEKIRLIDVDVYRFGNIIDYITNNNYEYNIIHEHILESVYINALYHSQVTVPIPYNLPFSNNTKKVIRYYNKLRRWT
jgi:hypothetical protein